MEERPQGLVREAVIVVLNLDLAERDGHEPRSEVGQRVRVLDQVQQGDQRVRLATAVGQFQLADGLVVLAREPVDLGDLALTASQFLHRASRTPGSQRGGHRAEDP